MARLKKRYKKPLIILSAALFFALVWIFVTCNVNPVIRKISEQKVKELAAVAVNDAAQKTVNETSYTDLIKIEKNDAGEIQLMQVNTFLVNVISRLLASKTQSNISDLGAQGINVPLGTVSGLTFLTGLGPDIKIKVHPMGAVNIDFKSEFLSAGINQTKHKINLFVTSSINIVMPGMNKTVVTSTQLALCETIIVGKVPNTYLNSNSLTEMLNLVP